MATLPLPPTTEVQITRVVKALYDAAPGNLYLNSFKEYAAQNGGVVGVADGLLYEHRNKTNAELAQMIVDNLGLAKVDKANNVTDPAKSAAQNAKDFLIWQFNVAQQTGATRGKVLVEALNNLATLGSNPTFGKAADFFNASIAQAYSYSIDPTHNTYDLATLKQADEVTIGEGGVVVPPPVPGMTFTLTTGADVLSPNSAVPANKTTSGDDLIRAVIPNSLDTLDAIDAGDGNDTLRANFTVNDGTGNGAKVTSTVQPVLANVEKIFFNAALTGTASSTTTDIDGAVLNLQLNDATGVKEIWSEGSTNNNASSTVSAGAIVNDINVNNVKLGTTVGVKDSAAAVTFDFAAATGATDAATLALADSTANVTLAEIETVTVNSTVGSVAATVVNSGILTFADAEKVVITGDQALAATVVGANIKEVDASAFTKALTLTHSTGPSALTIKGGSGADTFNITDNANDKVTIDMGAGNDTLNISTNAFHNITTGEGSDTINVTFAAATHKALDISTAAKLGESAIVISDFKSGTDVLNISATVGGNEIPLTGTQLATVAGAANLLTAAQEAFTQGAIAKGSALAAGDSVTFQYGADTYVVVDGNVTASIGVLSTDDLLIKLTGVSSVAAADITVA